MPRQHTTIPSLVPRSGGNSGLFGWATRLMALVWKRSARPDVPDDLLADILVDNGLRAREQERRRPLISGPLN